MKVSPHVLIYRFPLSAITSILNRGTGLYLSAVYVGTGIATLTPYSFQDIPYRPVVESTVVGCLVYHTLGGLRHFVWDIKPSLMTKSFAVNSSIGLLLSSLGITASYFYTKTREQTITRKSQE